MDKSKASGPPKLTYEIFFRINPLPLFIVEDRNSTVVAANEAAIRQYGYPWQELKGMPSSKLSMNGYFPRLAWHEESPTMEGFRYAGVWQHRRKDGSQFKVELNWYPVIHEGISGRLIQAKNAEEEKESERILRDREERLRALVQQMPATLWSTDRDLRITSSLGIGSEKLTPMDRQTGISLRDYFGGDDPNSISVKAHQRALQGESVSYETEWNSRTFQVKIEPLRDQSGKVSGCVGISFDTTERKQAEEALKESKERYRKLVDLSPDPIIVQTEGRIVYINRAGIKLLGAVNAMQIIGRLVLDFVHPDHAASMASRLRQYHDDKKDVPLAEEKFVRLDGEIIDVEVASIPFTYHEKPAVQMVVRDVTARKRAEGALRKSEERYRAFVEQSSEAIWRFEMERPVPATLSEEEQIDFFYKYAYLAECNDVMAQMYGFGRAEELIGTRLSNLLVRSDPHNVEYLKSFIRSGYRLVDAESHEVDKYGDTRFFSNNLVGIQENGMLVRAWGSQRDISERKHAEEMIRHLAYHDSLTGLPNRMLFHDRFGQALALAHRDGELLAMLFLDLDRFKTINDTLGHAVGDVLLKGVSERLTMCLREGDTLARLGGDEFMILLTGLQHVEDAAKAADRVLQSVRPSFHFSGHELHITTSVGISLYPYDGKDADTLIKNADIALYRAKEHGRDNYQLYTPAMNEKAFEKLSLENSLRRALERKEFVLYYQPQTSLRTGKIAGLEALIRWRQPGGEFLPPVDFISLAEDTGLIVPLSEWVLKTACAQNKEWQNLGLPNLYVSVNLSARHFLQHTLTRSVADVLEETGLDPRCLDLELTESSLMKNAETAAETLHELKSMGIRISIDDFGTGYSSLSYLKRFPITSLKIDQSFVRDCMSDPDDAAIISAIISMAHSLKLKVVAEGVETEGQLEFLRSLKCDFAQGALISQPLSAEEIPNILNGRPLWSRTPVSVEKH